MAIRPGTGRPAPEHRLETRSGSVFGREWWGLDRDRLEDELARQEAGRARDRAGEIKPH